MTDLTLVIPLLWAAGWAQLVVVAANFLIPGKLNFRDNLARLDPIVRQVFVVHHLFIVTMLVGFAILTLGFAPELASGSAIGRFLTGGLALFWLLRLVLQLAYYDREVRRANRREDVAYSTCVAFLALAYGVAAVVPA